MPNPILNALQVPNLRELWQMVNCSNPTQAFLQLCNSNPNLQPFAQMIRNGQNPELIARQLFKQKGIDIDEFIKGLKSQM